MQNVLLEPEGLGFLEGLIQPSVVLIVSSGKPVATGFFISRDGKICTAYHTFFKEALIGRKPKVEIEWQGHSYQAEIVIEFPHLDLCVLRLIELDTETPLLPIAIKEVTGQALSHQPAATFGFAGVTEKEFPLGARLFVGHFSGENILRDSRSELIFQNLREGKGISGAPILDLTRLRVVAFVTTGPKNLRSLGAGTAIWHLVEIFPDLMEQWQEAGRRFDRVAADFIGRRYGAPPAGLSPSILELLIYDSNQRVIDDYRKRGVFDSERYTSRRLEVEVTRFLEQNDSKILTLTGLTGSGKSSLLLHLAESLTPQVYLPVLLSCREIETSGLIPAAFAVLGLPVFTPEAAARHLATFPERRWVLIFEGLNEWPAFRLEHFRSAIIEISRLAHQAEGQNFKIIFSVRTEFLQERLVDLRAVGRATDGPLENQLGLFFYSQVGLRRPFLELTCSESSTEEEAVPELQTLYEHYRSLPGCRPKTTFDQLSEAVRKMISLPLLLSIFVRRYHDQEVPDLGLRSALVEDIVLPILNQRGEASEIFRQDAADLLKGLAGLVFEQEGAGLGRPYREVKKQVWQDRFIVETLLSASPILNCTSSESDDLYIAFRSDWFYEYFFAGYLWDEYYRNGGEMPTKALRHLLKRVRDSRAETHLSRAFVFLAEWALTRQPLRLGLIFRLLNLEEQPDFAYSFGRSFFDFLRMHEGFDQPASSLIRLLEDGAEQFSETGWRCLLAYVDYLETLGLYHQALVLLSAPARLWKRMGPGPLSASRTLALAYSHLHAHKIDLARHFAEDPELDNLPSELAAKRWFILGRCLQFQQHYREAMVEFSRGSSVPSPYGYRCRHQQAFIRFMQDSDYIGAKSDLETIIPNPFTTEQGDLASEPRLLHATCLTLLGEYAAGQAALQQVIETRRRLRQPHKEGTACRALADLLQRRFLPEAALAEIRRAEECLEESAHFLSLAHVREVHSQVLALNLGNLESAREVLDLALIASRDHPPSASWALQTSALLAVLAGRCDHASDTLRAARVLGLTPYQELRDRFIVLLGEFFNRVGPTSRIAKNARALRQDYEARSWGWYPGVLSLLLGALKGTQPRTPAAVRLLFGEDVNDKGIFRSYLYARIFPAA